MDKTDAEILDMLQADAALGADKIAGRLGLNPADCAARIARMEADGTILGRTTLVDPRKAGVGVTVFVAVTTPEHSPEWLARFHRVVEAFPEVMECYRMSGQVDYLLRVAVPDIDAYDRFYKRLISEVTPKDVSSTFAMEQIKFTTMLPLNLQDAT